MKYIFKISINIQYLYMYYIHIYIHHTHIKRIQSRNVYYVMLYVIYELKKHFFSIFFFCGYWCSAVLLLLHFLYTFSFFLLKYLSTYIQGRMYTENTQDIIYVAVRNKRVHNLKKKLLQHDPVGTRLVYITKKYDNLAEKHVYSSTL